MHFYKYLVFSKAKLDQMTEGHCTCMELIMVLKANTVAESLSVDWLSNVPCVSISSTATCVRRQMNAFTFAAGVNMFAVDVLYWGKWVLIQRVECLHSREQKVPKATIHVQQLVLNETKKNDQPLMQNVRNFWLMQV